MYLHHYVKGRLQCTEYHDTQSYVYRSSTKQYQPNCWILFYVLRKVRLSVCQSSSKSGFFDKFVKN